MLIQTAKYQITEKILGPDEALNFLMLQAKVLQLNNLITTRFISRQLKQHYVIPFYFSSLPKGVQIGRSEVKAVAEKRKLEIELFLATLFDLTAEISHSDLVYTFFHPLLRDQEDTDIHIKKLKNKGKSIIITSDFYFLVCQ